eukprot:1065902-Karenia_brevis.AAC.1
MQGVIGSAVDGERGLKCRYCMGDGVMRADCGILDACGMVYKPMGQRNTNPIGSEADEAAGLSLLVVERVASKESLELPAMQG